MDILDLPLEKQVEIAKECGFSSVEKWREWIKETDKMGSLDDPILTEAERAEKIKAVKENPDAIEFYKRVYGNDTTIEEVIEMIKSS